MTGEAVRMSSQLRLEWVDPTTLSPNPRNWRRHPKAQRDALEEVLSEVGWAGALLYNEATGRLIDGHLRLDVMRDSGEPVPVLIGSWTEEQERVILATLDPIAAMAEADAEKVRELLDGIGEQSAAVQAVIDSLAEEAGIVLGPEPPEDPGAQIDRAEELREKWGVREGQLWELGEHRLICGDCTDHAVVARVMGREKARMIFADPP